MFSFSKKHIIDKCAFLVTFFFNIENFTRSIKLIIFKMADHGDSILHDHIAYAILFSKFEISCINASEINEVHHTLTVGDPIAAWPVVAGLRVRYAAVWAIKRTTNKRAFRYFLKLTATPKTMQQPIFEKSFLFVAVFEVKLTCRSEFPKMIDVSLVYFACLQPFYGAFYHLPIFKFACQFY